jgi:hypothetical protein
LAGVEAGEGVDEAVGGITCTGGWRISFSGGGGAIRYPLSVIRYPLGRV